MNEHDQGATTDSTDTTDREAAYAGDVPDTPVDRDIVTLARDMEPATALDLGCGSGQNTWRTSDRFDLIISTYALPPRGPGRVHALTTARDAVAPGGCALIAEFEVSLAESGWMAEENLVTLEEITDMFPGVDLVRDEVKVTAHTHGEETSELPIVIVVAQHPGPLTTRPR